MIRGKKVDANKLVFEKTTKILAKADEDIKAMEEQFALADTKMVVDIFFHEERLATGLNK